MFEKLETVLPHSGTTSSGTLDSNVIGSQMARFHTVCKHHTLYPDSVSQVPRNVKFDG